MSTITHSLITVTSELPLDIHFMWAEAVRIFGESVTDPVPGTVNCSQTFMIAPSGSKDGWPHADEHDAKIKEFAGIVYRSDFAGEALLITHNCGSDGDGSHVWLMRIKDD